MAERPILFSGPLVRAILAGRKTETRRLVGDRTSRCVDTCGAPSPWPKRISTAKRSRPSELVWGGGVKARYIKPLVEVGDRLWVRETWTLADNGVIKSSLVGRTTKPPDTRLIYRADDEQSVDFWRPSIHMPRWAARIFLRVTDVRAERLQAIDDAAAIAEGIDGHPCGETCPCCEGSGDFANDPRPGCKNCSSTGRVLVPRREFSRIWDAIYGNKPGASWGADPWVWVVKFALDEVRR